MATVDLDARAAEEGGPHRVPAANVHTFNRHRTIAAVLALLCVPLAIEVEALVTMALMAGLAAGLIAFEVIRFREARARLRASVHV